MSSLPSVLYMIAFVRQTTRELSAFPMWRGTVDTLLWYDTIEEFNVDWKAERGQLNLAHITRNKKSLKRRNYNKQTPVPT